MTYKAQFERIKALVDAHNMPLARLTDHGVEVSCECVYPDGAVCCTMPETISTFQDARDWLGY